ncbi:class I SAM-dependent methyltransferase [Terrisporobacter petrolearius]|uniref:class I SAM-dependent methyltransferase n=1 Tax=Terrisporobacter petrolearius TaxID=1460447 RepID=UPI0031CC536E
MDDLNYWKDKWIEVGREYILNKKTTKETIAVWDESSKTYDETVSNSRINIIYKLKEDYINEDSIVLDLGCGTGAYSMELSKICKEVHAMDYSDGMLNILKAKISENNIKNIKVIKNDWNNLDLKAEGMDKKYDFVISSLNPGCYNPSSLMKINEASKGGCCYIGTDGKGQNKLLNKADDEILGERIKGCDISNIIYPYNILYFSGYNPSVFYIPCNWEGRNTYEKGVSKLINRYKDIIEINYNVEEKIKHFVKSHMEGDLFIDKSENNLGIILWRTI